LKGGGEARYRPTFIGDTVLLQNRFFPRGGGKYSVSCPQREGGVRKFLTFAQEKEKKRGVQRFRITRAAFKGPFFPTFFHSGGGRKTPGTPQERVEERGGASERQRGWSGIGGRGGGERRTHFGQGEGSKGEGHEGGLTKNRKGVGWREEGRGGNRANKNRNGDGGVIEGEISSQEKGSASG